MNLIFRIKVIWLNKLYNKGEYLRISYKLNNNFLLQKIMTKRIEYIWYCPREHCSSIITKTKVPFLDRGKIFKCSNCKEKLTSEQLILYNKRNIKKYLDSISEDNN